MEGWISIHRRITQHPDYFAEPFTRMGAWIDLIIMANYRVTTLRVRGVMVTVKRGEVAAAQMTLADRWKWSRGKVGRFLDELEKGGQITRKKSNVIDLIVVVNYEQYQDNLKPENRAVEVDPGQVGNEGGQYNRALASQSSTLPKNAVLDETTELSGSGTADSTTEFQKNGQQTEQQKNGVIIGNSDVSQSITANSDTANDTTDLRPDSTTNGAADSATGKAAEKHQTDTSNKYNKDNKSNKDTYTHNNSFQVSDFSARVRACACELLDWVAIRFPDIAGMPEPLNETQAVWLVQKYEVEDIRRLIAQMHNNNVAGKGKLNTYSTLTAYIGKDDVLKEKRRNGNNAEWNRLNAEAINRGYLKPRPVMTK